MFCPVATVTLSTTSPVVIKQWYKDGFAIPLATASSVIATESGNYILAVFSGSCGKVSEQILQLPLPRVSQCG